jgi:hypothetical protein
MEAMEDPAVADRLRSGGGLPGGSSHAAMLSVEPPRQSCRRAAVRAIKAKPRRGAGVKPGVRAPEARRPQVDGPPKNSPSPNGAEAEAVGIRA